MEEKNDLIEQRHENLNKLKESGVARDINYMDEGMTPAVMMGDGYLQAVSSDEIKIDDFDDDLFDDDDDVQYVVHQEQQSRSMLGTVLTIIAVLVFFVIVIICFGRRRISGG